MREALRLARRARGETSPNPMVGAILVRRGKIIGRGWHRRAGLAHAEVNAIEDAVKNGHATRGATLSQHARVHLGPDGGGNPHAAFAW